MFKIKKKNFLDKLPKFKKKVTENKNIQKKIVYIDLKLNNDNSKRIIIEFFNIDNQEVVNNFINLCKIGVYNNVYVHRIIESFLIQTGDITMMNGKGGKGYETIHLNEPIKQTLSHNDKGLLSMIIEKNKIESQFILTLDKVEWLDNKSVIIGKVIEGFEIIEKLEKIKTNNSVDNIPLEKCIITATGVFENINDFNKYKEFIRLFEDYSDIKNKIKNTNINNILFKQDDIYDKKNYKNSIDSINWNKLPILEYNTNFFIYNNKVDFNKKEYIKSNIPIIFTNNMIFEIKDFITFENNILFLN